MKNLIRTYVDPMLEDRIKLLAESSGLSISAITAELIQNGLNIQNPTPSTNTSPAWLEEILYLQFLNLQISLYLKSIDSTKFTELKNQSRQWAQQKAQDFNKQSNGL